MDMSIDEEKFEYIRKLLDEKKNVYVLNRKLKEIRKEKGRTKNIYVLVFDNGDIRILYPSEIAKVPVKVY